MTAATSENIAEVAHARIKAIREHAASLAVSCAYSYDGDSGVILAVVQSDENLLSAVIRKAVKFAGRAGTAQAAVQWAISDLTPYEALEPDKDPGQTS